jgi:hypothetical protein
MKHYELSPAQFALIEDLLPPNGQRVYHRFSRWRRNGMIDRILERLHLRLDSAPVPRQPELGAMKHLITSLLTTHWADHGVASARRFISSPIAAAFRSAPS